MDRYLDRLSAEELLDIKKAEEEEMTPFYGRYNYLKLYFGQSGMKLGKMRIALKEEIK